MLVPNDNTQSSILMKGEGVISPVGEAVKILPFIGLLNDAVLTLTSPPGAVTFNNTELLTLGVLV